MSHVSRFYLLSTNYDCSLPLSSQARRVLALHRRAITFITLSQSFRTLKQYLKQQLMRIHDATLLSASGLCQVYSVGVRCTLSAHVTNQTNTFY